MHLSLPVPARYLEETYFTHIPRDLWFLIGGLTRPIHCQGMTLSFRPLRSLKHCLSYSSIPSNQMKMDFLVVGPDILLADEFSLRRINQDTGLTLEYAIHRFTFPRLAQGFSDGVLPGSIFSCSGHGISAKKTKYVEVTSRLPSDHLIRHDVGKSLHHLTLPSEYRACGVPSQGLVLDGTLTPYWLTGDNQPSLVYQQQVISLPGIAQQFIVTKAGYVFIVLTKEQIVDSYPTTGFQIYMYHPKETTAGVKIYDTTELILNIFYDQLTDLMYLVLVDGIYQFYLMEAAAGSQLERRLIHPFFFSPTCRYKFQVNDRGHLVGLMKEFSSPTHRLFVLEPSIHDHQ